MRSNQGTVQLVLRREYGEGLPSWLMEAAASRGKVTLVVEACLDEVNSRIETMPVTVYNNEDLSGSVPYAVTHTIDFTISEAEVKAS